MNLFHRTYNNISQLTKGETTLGRLYRVCSHIDWAVGTVFYIVVVGVFCYAGYLLTQGNWEMSIASSLFGILGYHLQSD